MRISLQKQRYKIDGLNMKLLSVIENTPLTKEQIAEELKIQESTVRARICEMINRQIAIKFVGGEKKYKAIVANFITQPICPKCGSANSYGIPKELLCKDCGKVFSKEDFSIV